MDAFSTLTSNAVPFARDNIDTDQILPARYLARPRNDNHGEYLFRDLRQAADFPLNRPQWQAARIVLGGRNFACGSSREAAVWALFDAGFRCAIAPSFGSMLAVSAAESAVAPLRTSARSAGVSRRSESSCADR